MGLGLKGLKKLMSFLEYATLQQCYKCSNGSSFLDVVRDQVLCKLFATPTTFFLCIFKPSTKSVYGKWFEPRGISYWFVVIFRVRIAFRKTVVTMLR